MKLAFVFLISLLSVVSVQSEPGAFDDVVDWFAKAKVNAGDWLDGKISSVKKFYESVQNAVKTFYDDHIEPFLEDLVDIFKKIKSDWPYISERLGGEFNVIQRKEVRAKINGIFIYITKKLDVHFVNTLDKIQNFINNFINKHTERIVSMLTSQVSQSCQQNIAADIKAYTTVFAPKMNECVKEVRTILENAYEFIKKIFLSIPDIVFDLIEELIQCYHRIKETKDKTCIASAGASILEKGYKFVTDFISVKVLLVAVGGKLVSAKECIRKAAKDTSKNSQVMQTTAAFKEDLKQCGQEGASALLTYMFS